MHVDVTLRQYPSTVQAVEIVRGFVVRSKLSLVAAVLAIWPSVISPRVRDTVGPIVATKDARAMPLVTLVTTTTLGHVVAPLIPLDANAIVAAPPP